MFTPGAMASSADAMAMRGRGYDPMGFLRGPGGVGVVAERSGRRDRSSAESDDTAASGEDATGRATTTRKPGAEERHEAMPEAGVTCACCLTQKTPLWRNGPTGAKTLCNACGVRFKNGRIVVDAATGDVVAVPAPGRKRPAPDAIVSHMKKHAAANNASAGAFRGTSFAYKHVHDARLIELERVGARDAFPRVHSATILTDYDGAVLLMLLHYGDGSDEDED